MQEFYTFPTLFATLSRGQRSFSHARENWLMFFTFSMKYQGAQCTAKNLDAILLRPIEVANRLRVVRIARALRLMRQECHTMIWLGNLFKMNAERVQLMLKQLQSLFCVLIGLQSSTSLDSVLPVSINVVLILAETLLFLKDELRQSDSSTLRQTLKGAKLFGLCIQWGFFASLGQFGLGLACLFELQKQAVYFILAVIILNGALNIDQNKFVTHIPESLLLYFSLAIELGMAWWSHSRSKERKMEELNQIYVEQTFKQRSQDLQRNSSKSPLENGQGSEIQIRQELNGLKLSQNNLGLSNDDGLILGSLPWIQNQPTLVYTEELSIVYQTVFLGKLTNVAENERPAELEQLFLQTQIEVGGKELNDLISHQPFDESVYSDGSFMIGNVNDNHRYKVKEYFTLRDLGRKLLDDFDKCNQLTFYLYKFRSLYFMMDTIQIKAFVHQVNKKRFYVLLFEQLNARTKQSIDINQSVVNIFATFVHESISYVNCILTFVILQIHEHEKLPKHMSADVVISHCNPMRMMTLRYNLFLNSMRDYIFYIQNQLFLRISAFKLNELIDELLLQYQDNLRMREVGMLTSIDLSENNTVIYSDLERCKQILACLLTYCLKYTSSTQIKLDVKSYTLSGVMIAFKDSLIAKDEYAKKQISTLVKNINAALKTQKFHEVDLNNPLELQICCLLSYQLSGTFKRGLEFLYDSHGYGTFTFVVESQTSTNRHQNLPQDHGPIKILGQRKYFETSLSLLLAQDSSQYKEDSKYFSLSQLSKQFSMKPSDPVDLQSAYFSQISRIKQDSSTSKHLQSGSNPKQSKENNQSFSGTQKQNFNQDSLIQQTYKNSLQKNKPSSHCKSESNHDSLRTYSQLDFGAESSTPSIHPPELHPKFLASVIKYSLRLNCCAKVIIIDNDHYSVMALQTVLTKYNIKCDKAFNGIQAQQMIELKQRSPCHCGNRNYLLYFIELQLPIMSGLDLVRVLKQKMALGQLDRGFSIALATFVDLNCKLECFKSGVDYFIAKPFDLVEIGATVQYLDV